MTYTTRGLPPIKKQLCVECLKKREGCRGFVIWPFMEEGQAICRQCWKRLAFAAYMDWNKQMIL